VGLSSFNQRLKPRSSKIFSALD